MNFSVAGRTRVNTNIKTSIRKVNTKRLGSMLIVQKQRQNLEELLRSTHMTDVIKTTTDMVNKRLLYIDIKRHAKQEQNKEEHIILCNLAKCAPGKV